MKRPSAWKLGKHVQDLFESLFREVDQVALKKEIDALVARNPGVSREKLARRLIDRAAMSTAIVGAGAGATGGAIGLLAMAPDIANLVRQQSRLVLAIAFLYGNKPDLEERFREVLATLAVSTGASAGRQGVRYFVERGFDTDVARTIARRIAGRFVERKLPDLAPVVGSVAGAVLNYLTVRATGRVAVDYFSRQEKLHQEKSESAIDAPVSRPRARRSRSGAAKGETTKGATRKRTATDKPKTTKKTAKSPAATKRSAAKNAVARKSAAKKSAAKRGPRKKSARPTTVPPTKPG